MKFYVGQEVLCIKTHSQGTVARGRKYVVNGIKRGFCKCHPLLLDVGVEEFADIFMCPVCKAKEDVVGDELWIGAVLFVPIDNTLSETTVEELLNEPQPR